MLNLKLLDLLRFMYGYFLIERPYRRPVHAIGDLFTLDASVSFQPAHHDRAYGSREDFPGFFTKIGIPVYPPIKGMA